MINGKINLEKKNNIKLKGIANVLRRNTTPEEKSLWYSFLREYPIKFYRQRVIGNYIVDFYCAKAKLVIELDGRQHGKEEAMEYDAIRTAYMESLGLKVLRFRNRDIHSNFKNVCRHIDISVKERL